MRKLGNEARGRQESSVTYSPLPTCPYLLRGDVCVSSWDLRGQLGTISALFATMEEFRRKLVLVNCIFGCQAQTPEMNPFLLIGCCLAVKKIHFRKREHFMVLFHVEAAEGAGMPLCSMQWTPLFLQKYLPSQHQPTKPLSLPMPSRLTPWSHRLKVQNLDALLVTQSLPSHPVHTHGHPVIPTSEVPPGPQEVPGTLRKSLGL